jgi:hypothetical protein
VFLAFSCAELGKKVHGTISFNVDNRSLAAHRSLAAKQAAACTRFLTKFAASHTQQFKETVFQLFRSFSYFKY